MRYVMLGAGAIGGAIAGRLAELGRDVIVIARGDNLAVLRREGLQLVDPNGSTSVPVTAAADPSDVEFRSDDVVILATKSQDTEEALASLEAGGAPRGLAVVCAQNGVDNERMASRRGFVTYGMCVTVPAFHLEPGVVELQFAPVAGILDVGRYPTGSDAVAEAIAADLTEAGFVSRARQDIMRWKYAKLMGNVVSSLEAACGAGARDSALAAAARREAEDCYRAAEIDYATSEEVGAANAPLGAPDQVSTQPSAGGSAWQSLSRSRGRIEADWLNGEIVLLGALTGVQTPINEGLRRLANRLAREHTQPGTVPLDVVERELQS
jgi:2-dehydropantoate 2-reductase